MNYVMLIGRLVKNPELKHSTTGKSYCKFTIAVTKDFKPEEANFINCTVWEKKAEAMVEYVKKGQRIAIQGRIDVNSYEKEGNKTWTTEIIVDKIEFLEISNNQKEEDNTEEKIPV